MTPLSDLTAAPAEVQLLGKTLRMSPLSMGAHGEYERWVQARALAIGAPLDHALAIGFFTREAAATLNTQEGMARAIWLGIRQNHPEISLEVLMAEKDRGAWAAAMDEWNRINFPKAYAAAQAARAKLEGLTPAPSTEPSANGTA